MKKVAVVIKHSYRDTDFRVDIMEVPLATTRQEVKDYVESQMLGSFEVVAITAQLNLNREFKPKQSA